jgi:hypothetical protein
MKKRLRLLWIHLLLSRADRLVKRCTRRKMRSERDLDRVDEIIDMVEAHFGKGMDG